MTTNMVEENGWCYKSRRDNGGFLNHFGNQDDGFRRNKIKP